jgi:hypothetical protein
MNKVGKEKTINKTFIANCGWCSKTYQKSISTKGKTGDFCTLKCFHAFARGNEEQYLEKVCINCQKTFTCKFNKQKTFCSYSCSKSGTFHHFFGKEGPTKGMKPWTYGLTKETDNRIEELSKKVSATHKQQFEDGIRNNSGENNPNHINKRKQQQRTPEQFERYSSAAIKRLETYSGPKYSFEKGKYFSIKEQKEFPFRSSYEKRMMICLDSDPDVVSFQYEPFSIMYDFQDLRRRYLIDFSVEYKTEKALIECKSNYMLNDEVNLAKYKAAKEFADKNQMKYMVFVLKDIENYEKVLGLI